MYFLESLERFMGQELIIHSGARCENHNKKVKGSPTSSHLKGIAADVECLNSLARYGMIEHLIKNLHVKRIGIYKTFIHFDIDTNKIQRVIWFDD